MSTRMQTAAMLTLLAVLCGCGQQQRHYPAAYLMGPATHLEGFRDQWIKQGKPSTYDISTFGNETFRYFKYTNTVTYAGRPYKCLFGMRGRDWPAGVLTIAEDGSVLWFRDRDGKVTFAPEMNGVAW